MVNRKDMRIGRAGSHRCRINPRPARPLRLSAHIAVLLALLVSIQGAHAQDGQNVPRFASVGAGKVNVRQGPGLDYAVKFQYTRKGYPVKIVAEADDWWLVEDYDGDSGWVSSRLLSSRHKVLVTGDPENALPVALRGEPDDKAPITAALEPGVILDFQKCQANWCLVEHRDGGRKHEGWIHLSHIWGGRLDD